MYVDALGWSSSSTGLQGSVRRGFELKAKVLFAVSIERLKLSSGSREFLIINGNLSYLGGYRSPGNSWLGLVLTQKIKPLCWKYHTIEFEFDVKFSTLLQPCKQYIKILRQITHLHAIMRPHWNFRCICHNLHHAITYIEVTFDVRYFQWCSFMMKKSTFPQPI